MRTWWWPAVFWPALRLVAIGGGMERGRMMVAAALAVLWLWAPAGAVSAQGVLELVEPWANVWAGEEALYHVQLAAGADPVDRVPWRLHAGAATVQRGEAPGLGRPGDPADVPIALRIPPVHEGTVAALTLSVGESVQQRLWAFPARPFAGREQWLKHLAIHLYDPVGATREQFDRESIPYRDVAHLDPLSDLAQGILVIGEGIALDDVPALVEVATLAAQRIPVLCLAPASGEFTLPGTDDAGPPPDALRLEGIGIITALDKRLDATGWPPAGTIPHRTIRVEAGRSRVLGSMADGENGWVWLEAEFPQPGGRFVLCGIRLIEAWETGPTPRYLFARILESIQTPPEDNP
jgi:hypothetical protein